MSMSVAMLEPTSLEAEPSLDPGDQIVTIDGLSWDQYEAILDALGDQAGLHLTYLEGTLELMSPGKLHEKAKKTIARLLEAYADEMGIDLIGYGNATFRKKAKERGIEPDECYVLDESSEVPELAIEVVYTSGRIDKLTVYSGLEVPEVWLWKGGKLAIFWLGPGGYEPSTRSRLLPELNVAELVSFMSAGSQPKAVRTYRERLRERVKPSA